METVKTLFDRLQENSEANKKHFTKLLLDSLLKDEEFMNDAESVIYDQEESGRQIYELAEYIRTEYVEMEKIDAMKNREAEEYLCFILHIYFDYYEIAKTVIEKLSERKAA